MKTSESLEAAVAFPSLLPADRARLAQGPHRVEATGFAGLPRAFRAAVQKGAKGKAEDFDALLVTWHPAPGRPGRTQFVAVDRRKPVMAIEWIEGRLSWVIAQDATEALAEHEFALSRKMSYVDLAPSAMEIAAREGALAGAAAAKALFAKDAAWHQDERDTLGSYIVGDEAVFRDQFARDYGRLAPWKKGASEAATSRGLSFVYGVAFEGAFAACAARVVQSLCGAPPKPARTRTKRS